MPAASLSGAGARAAPNQATGRTMQAGPPLGIISDVKHDGSDRIAEHEAMTGRGGEGGSRLVRPLLFAAADTSYRSDFSSSPSYSRYLVVDGYSLINARVGFRAADGWTVFLWSRNLLNRNYYELLTAAPGNNGLFVGQPGDGRTVGLTLRLALKGK